MDGLDIIELSTATLHKHQHGIKDSGLCVQHRFLLGKRFKCKNCVCLFFITLNMSFGCLKEPSQ